MVKGVIEVKDNELVVVKLPDRPGELSKLTDKLTKRGVDLEALYILSRQSNETHVALKPSNISVEKLLEIIE